MCANHSHLIASLFISPWRFFLQALDKNEIISFLNEGRMGVIQLSCACHIHGYAHEDCIKQVLSFLTVS